MASNHSVDRLFREQTGNFEMQPSADAWSKIETGIQSKRAPVLMWRIAAAVTLLMTSAVAWWTISVNEDQPQLAATIEVNAPILPEMFVLEIPERTTIPVQSTPAPIRQAPVIAPIDNLLSPDELATEQSMLAMESIPMLQLEKRSNVTEVLSFEMTSMAPQSLFETSHKEKVNIFYYADATSEDVNASKGKLAKIIDYARATTPIDWVGDFRNKKDEWIDNVFSLD